MTKPVTIQWPRIVAESLAIVGSILLAFAIDAWWEDRQQRELERGLLTSLLRDFQASQDHALQWAAGHGRVLDVNRLLLDRLRSAGPGESVTVPALELTAAVAAATYSPTDSTLNAAISSGQIELIRDLELRRLLAEWRQMMDDTSEDETLIRHIVTDQVVPLVSSQVGLADVFAFEQLTGWFVRDEPVAETGPYVLANDSRIQGAIAERIFYQGFVVDGLASMLEIQQAIIDRLQSSLDS